MSEGNKKVLWQGKSWCLVETEQKLTDGSFKRSAYIDHPGAVVMIPLRLKAGRHEVLMISQYRPALGETILELPAGTREWNEEWQVCAQRELREETSFRAGQLIELGRSWPAPGVSNEELRIFLATGLSRDPLPKDVDEEIEVVPYPLAELIAMALDGRLIDAKTIVGIMRVASHLRLF